MNYEALMKCFKLRYVKHSNLSQKINIPNFLTVYIATVTVSKADDLTVINDQTKFSYHFYLTVYMCDIYRVFTTNFL